MPATLPAGPYSDLRTVEGRPFPYYIIPFDKNGVCEAPETRAHLIKYARNHSDVFLFSHGWNNDWSAARSRYQHFLEGFQGLRSQYRLPVPAEFRPLLVGIFWPSQAMAWFESEVGPEMASSAAMPDDEATVVRQTLGDIASALPTRGRARFYELAQAPGLDETGAGELAAMLAGLTLPDDEAGFEPAPTEADLFASAVALSSAEPDFDGVGTAIGAQGSPDAAFGIGRVLKTIDPRNLIKPFTVWQMKDRAGQVGGTGVSKLLQDLLAESSARVHLLGHSFGCKVVMTAVSRPAALPRKVESALLLQAAVSQYAFAPAVPERNVPGGFFAARKRVERPIVATFSRHDRPLTSVFHLALRRHEDIGELQFAADGPLSRFAALGGYGPHASGEDIAEIQDPTGSYDLSGEERVIGLDASRAIGGHSDISNKATWWLAYSLATAHLRNP